MVIRWNRVFGVLLGIVLLVLLIRGGIPLDGLLEGLGEIGEGHARKGQVERVATLGLICITIVAVIKLLTQRSGK